MKAAPPSPPSSGVFHDALPETLDVFEQETPPELDSTPTLDDVPFELSVISDSHALTTIEHPSFELTQEVIPSVENTRLGLNEAIRKK